MSVSIVSVEGEDDLKQFIQLPFILYRGNPYWAPPLRLQEKSFLIDIPKIDQGIATKMFLAKRDNNGETVGRIQIIINQHEIDYSGEHVARFNKIEFIHDKAVCVALLNAAEAWAANYGITRILGPCGYTNFDAAGILLEGFNELSNASTVYNPPYYSKLIEGCGYQSCLECLEYEFSVPSAVPEKITKFSNYIKERYDLQYAKLSSKKEKLMRTKQIMELFNICQAHLSTFIPVSDALREYYFKKYVTLIKNDYMSLVLDKGGRLVGFGLTLPSYTRALQKANGSLFPFGLYHLWKVSHKNNRAELLLIGIHPDYQKKGVTSMIFEQILQKFIDNGIEKVESNPELKDNLDVQNLWKEYDSRVHKRRACYYKNITPVANKAACAPGLKVF